MRFSCKLARRTSSFNSLPWRCTVAVRRSAVVEGEREALVPALEASGSFLLGRCAGMTTGAGAVLKAGKIRSGLRRIIPRCRPPTDATVRR